MKTVLTIAGFDPSSGAGVTADLLVFRAHGLFGTAAITSLTVQSTIGVQSSAPVSAEQLEATLDCLEDDLPPSGIKIGMLATAANVESVARFIGRIRERRRIPVVLDPVLRSSSGSELLSTTGVRVLLDRLLPLVDVVTPNREELGVLAAMTSNQEAGDHFSSNGEEGNQEAQARALMRSSAELSVLVTGGDQDPPDDLLRTPDGALVRLRGERVATTSTHGTGCALSSALLCRLVLGDSLADAAAGAKAYVRRAMLTATPMGSGRGPLNHLWPSNEAAKS